MKKELQENLIKAISANQEIYNKFIVGFDNLIDWVVENKTFSKETILKDLLNKIGKEVSIKGKIRIINFLNKKSKQYENVKKLDWVLLLFNTVLTISIKLVRLKPYNIDFRKCLSASFNNIGDTYKVVGDTKKALMFFEKNLEVLEYLITKKP